MILKHFVHHDNNVKMKVDYKITTSTSLFKKKKKKNS